MIRTETYTVHRLIFRSLNRAAEMLNKAPGLLNEGRLSEKMSVRAPIVRVMVPWNTWLTANQAVILKKE